MFMFLRAKKPEIRCTIPGPSGPESVKMIEGGGRAEAGCLGLILEGKIE